MSKHTDFFLIERFLPCRLNLAAGLVSQGLAPLLMLLAIRLRHRSARRRSLAPLPEIRSVR